MRQKQNISISNLHFVELFKVWSLLTKIKQKEYGYWAYLMGILCKFTMHRRKQSLNRLYYQLISMVIILTLGRFIFVKETYQETNDSVVPCNQPSTNNFIAVSFCTILPCTVDFKKIDKLKVTKYVYLMHLALRPCIHIILTLSESIFLKSSVPTYKTNYTI